MEKRNTLLLTVIAIATLLVAVVGATFAYFASNTNTTATANLTANTAAASSEFVATGSAIVLQVDAANMVYAQHGNQVTTNSTENAIEVTFKSGSTENLTCTYDVYYAWDTGTDVYNITSNATAGEVVGKEFTYSVDKKTDSGQFAEVKSETQFVNSSDTSDQVVYNASISNASADTATKDTYKVTVKFYNLDQQQSGTTALKDGKTWKIKFGIKNVVC